MKLIVDMKFRMYQYLFGIYKFTKKLHAEFARILTKEIF